MDYEEFDFENAEKYYEIRKSNGDISFDGSQIEVNADTGKHLFDMHISGKEYAECDFGKEFLNFIETPIGELKSHIFCRLTEPKIFSKRGAFQYNTYLYDVQRLFKKLAEICFDKDFYPDEFSRYTAAQRLILLKEIYPKRPFPQTLTQKFSFTHIDSGYLPKMYEHLGSMTKEVTDRAYQKYSEQELSDALELAIEHGDNSVIQRITNEFGSPFERDHGLDVLTSLIPDAIGNGVAVVYLCRTAEDLMTLAFKELLTANVKIKKCGYCGRYFIAKGNYTTRYCDRIPDGETFSCQTLAARKKYLEKTHNNEAVKLYSRYYKKFYARSKAGSMKPSAFKKWKYQAMLKRDECIEGKIDIVDFEEWLEGS